MQKVQKHGHDYTVIIDSKEFEWQSQYINGKQIRELGSIEAGSKIFLKVEDPWDDELIADEIEVDLGRPEVEEFLVRKKLEFTINGKAFEWEKQFISGAELRKLGGIAEDENIFLDIQKPDEDELIEDDQRVNLARSGIEHFVIRKGPYVVTLIVNGTPKEWDKKTISFKEVIILAFGHYIDSPTMVYTVGYEDGPKKNPEGSMPKGSSIFVKNKMIFHATATDKS